MKQSQISLFLSSIFLVLVGCQSVPESPTEINQALDDAINTSQQASQRKALEQLPPSVQQELMQNTMAAAKNGLLRSKGGSLHFTSLLKKPKA